MLKCEVIRDSVEGLGESRPSRSLCDEGAAVIRRRYAGRAHAALMTLSGEVPCQKPIARACDEQDEKDEKDGCRKRNLSFDTETCSQARERALYGIQPFI
jgi:hypothetical protein